MRTFGDKAYIVILTKYDDMGEANKKYFTYPSYSQAKVATEGLFNMIQEKIGGDEKIEFEEGRNYNPYHWKDEEGEFELEIVRSDNLEYGSAIQ